ncbi:hypothetical protein M569_17704 [Genlisea aurea]|uniref:Uncharacterized protein n=1 Tax=Genlisea aurea TaxID=192259 RepID=S8D368_9LAMI|nr:hypothetical protein M569_17704 [Genlisea aurea]
MARSRDVRGEFFVVPLQKVPIEEWGYVRPREKQIESFRRVANALEQQWIDELRSTWNSALKLNQKTELRGGLKVKQVSVKLMEIIWKSVSAQDLIGISEGNLHLV